MGGGCFDGSRAISRSHRLQLVPSNAVHPQVVPSLNAHVLHVPKHFESQRRHCFQLKRSEGIEHLHVRVGNLGLPVDQSCQSLRLTENQCLFLTELQSDLFTLVSINTLMF